MERVIILLFYIVDRFWLTSPIERLIFTSLEQSKPRINPMTKHYSVTYIKTGGHVGSIELKHPGWFFISSVSSHKGSRKGHATAEKAFPTWAKKMGCEMVARN